MQYSRQEARVRLGIKNDEFVYGFLGQLRPYKNVISLIKAFQGYRRAIDSLLQAIRSIKLCKNHLKLLKGINKLNYIWLYKQRLAIFYKAFDLGDYAFYTNN